LLWQASHGTLGPTILFGGIRFCRLRIGKPEAIHEGDKMLRTILLVLLVLLLLGALPAWPYSTAWGYYPSGGLGLILLVVLVLVIAKKI
jgi:hypothetical protein